MVSKNKPLNCHITELRNNHGFTIVELLVVIVVIGILAAITIVSYTGITQRAVVSSLQSDLNSASTQLKLDQTINGIYPTTAASANNGKGLALSSGNTFIDFQVNNATNPQVFCLTSRNTNGTVYRVTNDSAPIAGNCSGIFASGGSVADVSGYRIHTFTSSGTFTVSVGSGNVEVLVVAGGGGGSSGGGGAGGLLYSASVPVTAQTYTVNVGAGGSGCAPLVGGCSNGYNSSFNTLVAIGGGSGGRNDSAGSASSGGSGGGGGSTSSVQDNGGSGTAGQGNSGGTVTSTYFLSPYPSGGGGGAGGAGSNPVNASTSGNGGNGLAYSISGSSKYYAGGGGGAIWSIGTHGTGGNGGGGGGATANGIAGADNTGGGGGGVSGNSGVGGNGGSGIVIVRYLLP